MSGAIFISDDLVFIRLPGCSTTVCLMYYGMFVMSGICSFNNTQTRNINSKEFEVYFYVGMSTS